MDDGLQVLPVGIVRVQSFEDPPRKSTNSGNRVSYLVGNGLSQLAEALSLFVLDRALFLLHSLFILIGFMKLGHIIHQDDNPCDTVLFSQK